MTLFLGAVPASTTIYIPFATYDGATGASETCSGLAVTDIEIYKNGSVTQRSSDAGYTLLDTDGIDFDSLTGINGFSIDLSDNTDSGFYAVGSWYWVVVSSITADSQTVNFIAAVFRIVAAENTAGYVVTTIKDGTGTGELDTSSGGVLVASIANNAITAASIASDAITSAKIADGAIDAGALASDTITAAKIASSAITSAKFAAGAIDAAAIADNAIDRATFAADTGLQTIRSNTAQAGAAGTITLDASASATNDFYNGDTVFLTGGTGAGQYRVISDYVGATKVANVIPNWITNPSSDSTFAILPKGMVDLQQIVNVAVSTSTAQIGVNAVQAGGTAWGSGAITANSIASDAITSAKIATGAIDADAIADNAIDAGAIAADAITAAKIADGAIDANTFAAGAITASAIAADAIGASELASDAANEIADALLDRSAGVETGLTVRQAFRLFAAALLGKASGLATTTAVFRDTGDSKDRITATVDASGNRSAVTLDAS
jgi:hypothetical protein